MMIEQIGEPAMLEQLAEEAAELAQAALKLARIERDENPTPVTSEEAHRNLIEEYTDVVMCTSELGLDFDPVQVVRKRERFIRRWKEHNVFEPKKGDQG